ncbi:hypothetical protein NDU88_003622 [Pleurodeles waltl]|uniref:Uncharacterized protein n=1 Tax=Pleurodeles waltl TaxID=8319 RepID=A0AAV7T601_PLEWA|nr:hypothetical protein NDU88_003622 [Pleurodeles waltl]
MCQLTGGVVEGTVGAAGAVLWSPAALELWKTRSAVARFPLRGRSSGSSSGRASTSTLLTLEQRVDDGTYGAYVAGVKGRSSTAQTAEETVGLVRGRRKRGEKSLSSSKETGPTGEVNTNGKSGRCGGVTGEYPEEVPSVSPQWKKCFAAKLVKKGKVDSPVIARPKITPSLRLFQNPPLSGVRQFQQAYESRGRGTALCNYGDEKVGAEVRVEETVVLDKGEKIKDQCPVSAFNSESQEEQSGEIPPVTMVNNNHAPVSEANQASTKEACEILETKFNLLAKRMQFLEETVEFLKEDVVQIKQDLRESRTCEQDLQDKLERLENAARRNNLRILNIAEGMEGNNIKSYFTTLIKNTLQLEETEQDIAADIQSIHRDPFRRDPGRKKPRKVLINFLTYALKEKILLKALKQKL